MLYKSTLPTPSSSIRKSLIWDSTCWSQVSNHMKPISVLRVWQECVQRLINVLIYPKMGSSWIILIMRLLDSINHQWCPTWPTSDWTSSQNNLKLIPTSRMMKMMGIRDWLIPYSNSLKMQDWMLSRWRMTSLIWLPKWLFWWNLIWWMHLTRRWDQ